MKRNNLLLIIIFIVLIIIMFFVLQKQGEQSISTEEREKVLNVDSVSIDRLDIKSVLGEFSISKEGGEWLIQKPFRCLASQKHLYDAVSQVINMKAISIVSTNPSNQKMFNVDAASGTSVKIYSKGKLRANIIVGKAGSAINQTYIRQADSKEVLLVEGKLSDIFNLPLTDFRDKIIFNAREKGIREAKFQYSDESFELKFHDTTWTIDGEPTDDMAMSRLISQLTSLEADLFLDAKPVTMPEMNAQITIGETNLKVFEADSEKFFVQSSASPQFYVILKQKAEQFLKRKAELLKK